MQDGKVRTISIYELKRLNKLNLHLISEKNIDINIILIDKSNI